MEQTASEIFITLSRELRHLSELTCLLQDQLSRSGYEDIDVEAVQSLDILNQRLDCLATYAAHLGTSTPCSCAIPIDEAADQIGLAELASNLRGDQTAERAVTEIELFQLFDPRL